MKPFVAPREDGFPSSIAPFLTVVSFAFLTTMPVRIPGYAAVTPAFALMAVYHWVLYRPALLPAAALFAAGVLLDLLAGAPLGVSALVFLLARAALIRQRQFFIGRLFPFVWAGFALAAAGAIAAQWTIGGLINLTLLDPRAAALQWVLTVALFPAASWLLVRVQRGLLAGV